MFMPDNTYKPVDDELLEQGYHLQGDEAITEGQTLPNTVAPVGTDSFEGTGADSAQRWAVTPLYTTNHEHALVGEYLCDPNTGEPAIKRDDGTVINVSEIARINYHCEIFSNALSYLGLRAAKIYSLIPDDDDHVLVYDGNGLDGDVVFEKEDGAIIDKIAVSFDISVLEPVEGSSMLRMIDEDPVITLEYIIGNEATTRTVSQKASDYRYYTIPINESKFTLKGVRIPSVDASGYTCFIHSMFVAYR